MIQLFYFTYSLSDFRQTPLSLIIMLNIQKKRELLFASIDILRSSTTFENQNLRKKPTPKERERR